MLKPKDFFTLLSDETRLRCMVLMRQNGEVCVCEFTKTLKMSQPKISRHLAMLRKFKIVTAYRKGTWMYYKINENLPYWALQLISHTENEIKNLTPYASDIKSFTKMDTRVSCCK